MTIDVNVAQAEWMGETFHFLDCPGSIEFQHETCGALMVADAAYPDQWWDGRQFDRILLDAPCSASGVIRRHPDIKLLRREKDIETLVKQQAAILNAVWPMLKPGGMLVYATCSVFKRENAGQIEAFLAARENAEDVPIASADWGVAQTQGRQILTGDEGMDGFYYARLLKR